MLIEDSIVSITYNKIVIGSGICFLGGFVVTAKHLLHNKNISEYKIKIKDMYFSFSEIKTTFSSKGDICTYKIIDNYNVQGTFKFLPIDECLCSIDNFKMYCNIYTYNKKFSVKLISFSDTEIISDNPGINVGNSGSPVYCGNCKKFIGVVSGILEKERKLKISRNFSLNHLKFRIIDDDKFNFKRTLLDCSINEEVKKELTKLKLSYFKLKQPAKLIIKKSLLLRKQYYDFAQRGNIYQNQLLAEINYFNALLLINMSINSESIILARDYILETINIYEEILINESTPQNLEKFLHAKWLKSISYKQVNQFDKALLEIDDSLLKINNIKRINILISYDVTVEQMREKALLTTTKVDYDAFLDLIDSIKNDEQNLYINIKRAFEIASNRHDLVYCEKYLPILTKYFHNNVKKFDSLSIVSYFKALYKYYAILGEETIAIKCKNIALSLSQRDGWVGQMRTIKNIELKYKL